MATTNLRLILDEAEYELWAVEQYHIALERQLQQLIDQTPARTLRLLHDQGMAGDAAAVAVADRESAELIERVYPRYFRSPLLLIVCAVLEALLLNIADGICQLKGARLRANEIHGDFLDRIRRYFECVLDHPLNTDSEGWERIKAVFALRHCLIHANGVVGAMRPDQARRVLDLAQTLSGVTVVDGYLVLSAVFVDQSRTLVVRWLRELLRDFERLVEANASTTAIQHRSD